LLIAIANYSVVLVIPTASEAEGQEPAYAAIHPEAKSLQWFSAIFRTQLL